MKVKLLMLVCLLMAVLVAVGCAPTKAPEAKAPAGYERIRIVGSSLGSKSTSAAMVFAAVFNKYYPEIEWSSCSGNTATNVVYLTKGSQQVGMTNRIGYVDAYGFDKIRESRVKSLSMPTQVAHYFFVIPADKPWKDITEVPKGIGLCGGTPGSGSVAAEAWLQLAGLSKKDFNWSALGKDEAAQAWRGGKVDVLMISVSAVYPALLDMWTSPRKFKPMGLSPQQVAKAKAEQTFERLGYEGVGMSNVTEIAPEVFKEDVMCAQNATFLCCRDDFPEEIGYKMAKLIVERYAELVEMFAALKEATPQYHIKLAAPPFDIHSGVAKYYKEKGYLK